MSTPITQGIQSSESQEVCIYITVFHYTDQLTIEYHNSDCQSNEPITSQVRVTGAQRGKMGVSPDRSSDWWRKWRNILGGQSHSVAMQLKQSGLVLNSVGKAFPKDT